jgi:hypothetical protein
MIDRASDRSRQGGGFGLPLSALIAAIREAAEKQGLSLPAVAQSAGLGDLLVQVEAEVEADQAREGELLVNDVAALGGVLGVRASELIARAEALAREGRER